MSVNAYISILRRGIKRYYAYPYRLIFSLSLNLMFVVLLTVLWSHLLHEDALYLTQYFLLSEYVVVGRVMPYVESKYSSSIKQGWCLYFLKPVRLSTAIGSEVIGYQMVETSVSILTGYLLMILTGFVPQPHTVILLPVVLLLITIYDFVIEYIIGGLAFYMYDVWGVNHVYGTVAYALSGGLVPLSSFPGWAQKMLDWLPFPFRRYYMIQFLLTGELSYLVMGGITLFFWSIMLGIFGYLLHRRGWKRFESQGG
ncbi:hypothetical protein J7K41_00865 [Candidatus Micrarchaeota archaeon]|nr:hypothetical protein [Candidatus Micrarchaeota archaeon]